MDSDMYSYIIAVCIYCLSNIRRIVMFDKAKLSKQIGWGNYAVDLPTKKLFEATYAEAKAGDENSAKMLIKWNRYGSAPKAVEEYAVTILIRNAMHELFT
jgi:hypothetical protein